MFPSTRKSLSLTLVLCITLAFALSASADVNLQQHRRGHLRLIKKRQFSLFGADSSDFSDSDLASSSDSLPALVDPNVSTKVTSATAVASTTSTSASSTSTSATQSTGSVSTASRSSSASSSSTTSSSSSTSTTSSPTPAPTSETLNLTDAPTNVAATTGSRVTVISISSAIPSPSASSAANTSATSTTKRTTLTVFIVIAASVGGAGIIWTIIRKWKFKPSSQFEDRMQPINWQPTDPDDGGIPGHRRRGSGASSFHSGTGHAEPTGYGATTDYTHGGYGGTGVAPGPPLNPIPDHDFTAGAHARAGLAPVGGYADLARGPSPQPPPQMQDLSSAPMYRPHYEQYTGGVPLHHQTGYATHDAYDYNGAPARY